MIIRRKDKGDLFIHRGLSSRECADIRLLEKASEGVGRRGLNVTSENQVAILPRVNVDSVIGDYADACRAG